MSRELRCRTCDVLLATLRDASIRGDIVCLCAKCATPPKAELPPVFGDLFGRLKK